MAEKFQEKRSGNDRRESARRGTGPELSIEQIYDGETDAATADSLPGGEQRVVELRMNVRRKEDRELDDFLAETGTD